MGLFRRKKRGMKEVQAKLDALQSEVNSLHKEARSLASRVSKTAGTAYDAAEAAYDGAGRWTVDSLDTMRGSVRDQPLAAVLVSLGAGAALAALLLRR